MIAEVRRSLTFLRHFVIYYMLLLNEIFYVDLKRSIYFDVVTSD